MNILKITSTQGHYNIKQGASSREAEPSNPIESQSSKVANEYSERQPDNIDQAKFNRLNSQKAQINQYAREIRAFDQKMEKVGAKINNMKKELSVIVKNYPPFPPGSEERIARLRRFNSFRKQMEQLTIPPQRGDDHVKHGAPASRQVGVEQGSLVIEAVGGEGFILSVRNSGTETDRKELRISKLSEDAGDSQIHNALEDLEKAGVAIEAHRKTVELSVQTVSVDKEDYDEYIISESNAEESSYALRRDMAMLTLGGFTKEPAQLVGLLN